MNSDLSLVTLKNKKIYFKLSKKIPTIDDPIWDWKIYLQEGGIYDTKLISLKQDIRIYSSEELEQIGGKVLFKLTHIFLPSHEKYSISCIYDNISNFKVTCSYILKNSDCNIENNFPTLLPKSHNHIDVEKQTGNNFLDS